MTTTNPSITAAESELKLPPVPKVGILCLIVMESALFTIFVVAYLYYIGKSLNGPFPKDVLSMPIIASVCLLSSSGTIVMSEHAFKKGDDRKFRLYWGITWMLGAIFLVLTGLEWKDLIEHGLSIHTNLFGSTYYPLVGLHASHVIIGLFLLALVFLFSATGRLSQKQLMSVEVISWYWHFVDAVWVVVFTVVYIIGVYA
jgi:cytochrome c oxidase subunit 3/cytochrome o ubiquinol oxidase subunit 3